MILNREEAAKKAESMVGRSNDPGMCQQVTRLIYGAPSVGDVDGDGRADAVDGWFSEPKTARHPDDRNPPRGTPVSFGGGRTGDGHRAVALGGGRIGSTDMESGRYRAGTFGVATIAEIERSMGVHYLGWSETISGHPIPLPPKPDVKPSKPPKPKKPNQVTKGRDFLESARAKAVKNDLPKRAALLKKVLNILPKR